MTETSDNSHVSNSHSPTVGERLRLAREAKKITISEVVAQLRLTKENVVYLESDQWDKLHGRPYARGYFSSYVNFLDLPHEEMLALFNMEYTSKETSMDGFKRSEEMNQKGAGSGWFKSLLLILVLIASAWFGYQYWLERQEETPLSDAVTDSGLSSFGSGQDTGASFSSSIVEPLSVVDSGTIRFTEAEPEEMVDISTVEERAVEQQTDEIEVFVADELVDIDAHEIIERPELDQQSELESEENSVVNTDEAEIVSEIKTLVMQFSGDCWVEISDRNNKKLLHKIVLADEIVEINGEWPLQVLLGNASGVTLAYNNTDFDIAPHTRANVARFSVGEGSE